MLLDTRVRGHHANSFLLLVIIITGFKIQHSRISSKATGAANKIRDFPYPAGRLAETFFPSRSAFKLVSYSG